MAFARSLNRACFGYGTPCRKRNWLPPCLLVLRGSDSGSSVIRITYDQTGSAVGYLRVRRTS
jgi:hypothetical protein